MTKQEQQVIDSIAKSLNDELAYRAWLNGVNFMYLKRICRKAVDKNDLNIIRDYFKENE